MSEMLRIAAFAVLAALGAFLLKSMDRQTGTLVALAAGIMLLPAAFSVIAPAVETLSGLSARAGIGGETAGLMMKMVGVAYVAEFAGQTCRDAGEEGLARKTALCGKMLLLAQTVPLIGQILDLTLELLP